ncbi:MAG: hypothetical protein LBV47_04280 [Bacteroidales bacterium]|jgi:hypothetical protein|nr:hypothetical protein [Bacteroidales bacterium]
MKVWLAIILAILANYSSINAQENNMDELKNRLEGSAKSDIYPPQYLLWEHISPIEDYTRFKFHSSNKVSFLYHRSFIPNIAYTIMEGDGQYEVDNNIIKIYFEVFSIVQKDEKQRNVFDEKGIIVELEVEMYNGGMLVKQIAGRRIFAEDTGSTVFDFKENWNFSLEM